MSNYEINSNTLAIIPISNNYSQVIEENNKYVVSKGVFQIIDHSCRYFGSSYEGRHVGAIDMIGVAYKTPILIEETQNLIFFPTLSSKSKQCMWISLNHINNYEKYYKETKLVFKNGYELFLNISEGSLKNQIYRATLLDSIARKRRKIS